MSLTINRLLTIPDSELSFTFSRASGAGGQNVNKVNSRATLIWNVFSSKAVSSELKARFISLFSNRINQAGELLISSDRFREQSRNREDCILRLESMIQKALHKPKLRRKTKPSNASHERRITGKKIRSKKKNNRGRIKLGQL